MIAAAPTFPAVAKVVSIGREGSGSIHHIKMAVFPKTVTVVAECHQETVEGVFVVIDWKEWHRRAARQRPRAGSSRSRGGAAAAAELHRHQDAATTTATSAPHCVKVVISSLSNFS